MGAETPPLRVDLALNKGGFSGVRPQILKIFACGASKIPYKIPIESTEIPKFSRLRRANCAAGDFLWFQRATKRILPYKISAAGENFVVSERYKGYFMLHKWAPQAIFFGFRALLMGFYLTKWAPQAKILRFQSAINGILPYKMSAAGENFCGLDHY